MDNSSRQYRYFGMNFFNILFCKIDGLITRMVLPAKRGGPDLSLSIREQFCDFACLSANDF